MADCHEPNDAAARLDARDVVFAGRLLEFPPAVEARYERDTGARRAAHLRQTIFIGIFIYNVYIVSDFIAERDVFWVSLMLRALIVTPVSLAIAWSMTRVSPYWREWLVAIGITGCAAMPAFLFWLTASPLGPYDFFEVPLTLVFGNLMLVLRFRRAILVTVISMMIMLIAICTRAGTAIVVREILVLQMATTCFFTLYGNYATEHARRAAFLVALRETLRSGELETQGQVLTKLSITDPLTGLANRRMFDDICARWTESGLNLHKAVAVIMIDIDFFKRYNDHYGHQAGDACLRVVAAALAVVVQPPHGFLVRYGGEEFAVLLEEADAAAAETVVCRLRAAVAEAAIPHEAHGAGPGIVTISAGVAVAPEGAACTAAALLKAADEALYDAKRAGRNQFSLRVMPITEAPGQGFGKRKTQASLSSQ